MLNEQIRKMKLDLWPNEVALLQRVFEAVCEKRGLEHRSLEAEAVARDLLDYFRHGIRGERQLLAMFVGPAQF